MKPNTQRCKGLCDRVKHVGLFYLAPAAPSGRDSVCISCRLRAKRERRNQRAGYWREYRGIPPVAGMVRPKMATVWAGATEK